MNEILEKKDSQPKSMKTFLIMWIGQLISIIGSGLTGFGISVWIFTQTGKATPFALVAVAYNLPRILLQPVAGSFADRYNRKKIMILADTGAALVTLGFASLIFTDTLQLWHVYLGSALGSAFSTFQDPAQRASITMIVPKKNLARAGGLQQVGFAVNSIVVPILAAFLYAAVGLNGIILIDFITFFFAIGALLLINIPQPELKTEVDGDGKGTLWKDAVFGWNYIRQRPGLFGLLWYYAAVNFFLSLSGPLWGPLILSFGTEIDFGTVQMAAGVGMLLGGLVMGVWGGPKNRKILAIIAAIGLSSIGFLVSSLRPTVFIVALGQALILFFIPIASALSQAIWQVKVPADIQGRVFSIRLMIGQSVLPLANLLAGPLGDNVLEPLMAEGGALSATFVGGMIGVGTGRGFALAFMISGVFLFVLSLFVLIYPRIRNLEAEIPDAIPDDQG